LTLKLEERRRASLRNTPYRRRVTGGTIGLMARAVTPASARPGRIAIPAPERTRDEETLTDSALAMTMGWNPAAWHSARSGGRAGRWDGPSPGLDSALDHARAVAGDKDVAIGGGVDIVRQCLAAGVVDEIRLHLVPILLGGRVRLFGDGTTPAELAMTSVDQADGVAHLRYRVRR
jgi:RibD C-terminal domain